MRSKMVQILTNKRLEKLGKSKKHCKREKYPLVLYLEIKVKEMLQSGCAYPKGQPLSKAIYLARSNRSRVRSAAVHQQALRGIPVDSNFWLSCASQKLSTNDAIRIYSMQGEGDMNRKK